MYFAKSKQCSMLNSALWQAVRVGASGLGMCYDSSLFFFDTPAPPRSLGKTLNRSVGVARLLEELTVG